MSERAYEIAQALDALRDDVPALPAALAGQLRDVAASLAP